MLRYSFIFSLLLLLGSCNGAQKQGAAQQNMTVFAYLPAEIDTIRVLHRSDDWASFELIREENTVWIIKPLLEQPFKSLNDNLLRRYVAYYTQVAVDNIITSDNKELTDIIASEDWQYSIRVAARNKPDRTVQLYGIPAANEEGYDTDKCLAYIPETKEIAQASWISFDILLKKFQDFVEKK
ncbi:MAG: hypothetical protein FWH23_05025 [Bacteroidales bacterium]|nr:hypothetical protein [Bacteroidales bacterium]MCL2133473.1 hypothetical protein [Bacteroidales bacterium]